MSQAKYKNVGQLMLNTTKQYTIDKSEYCVNIDFFNVFFEFTHVC